VNLALLILLAATPAQQSWQFQTNGTPEVEVSNVNGSVRVEATDSQTVSVEVSQEGSEEERARFPVEVRQEGNDVVAKLCCGSCGKRMGQSCNNPVPTHFVVKVPRKASLEVSAVNAAVTLTGVAGAQEVSSVNGKVEVTGSQGKVEVSAVGAEVVLAPAALEATEVSTVAGNVKLKLPANADATVDFNTVGGSFNGGKSKLGSSEKRYGSGKHAVEVSTVSGSLDVEEAR
jgi:DUF4097 and DUF4098 domain-containing protein YvlB